MNALARRQLGRTDRYVRTGRLSLPADAPRHKLAFMAEEALRLCSLPGEDQGRVYYLRLLRVSELPPDGDRRIWLDTFQSALQDRALSAVHGSSPRAAAADAVYFRSRQEACETLLMRIATRSAPVAWFWSHVTGGDRNPSAPAQVAAVIEALLSTPAQWSAVAAAVLSVARQRDLSVLLACLPAPAIEHWLREMGTPDSSEAASVRFSQAVLATLERAIRTFGPDAPHVLWLASLAVIESDPASARERSAVRRARVSLQKVVEHLSLAARPSESAAQSALASPAAMTTTHATNSAPTPSTTAIDNTVRALDTAAPAERSNAADARDEFCFGEPTTGAGLYFLLNVLRHLEIERQHFSLFFLAHLFLRIADYAGIAPDDAILRWADVPEPQSLEPEKLDQRLVRIWMLQVRRWCWRHGRISACEVVRRPGYVALTTTDLDVTLSLDSADIRIRRIGLDLDPGWLPWFGRVVHFHYRYPGDLRG